MAVEQWLRAFASGKSQKPLLLVGPCGSGKTSLLVSTARRLCKLPMEGLDDQDMADFLAPAGLRPRGPAFIDGIEALDVTERDAVKDAIAKGPKGLARPLVLTADDLFEAPAKNWKDHCIVVRIERPKKAFLMKVLKTRWPTIEEAAAEAAAESSNGSVSLAMNTAGFLHRVAAGASSGTAADGAVGHSDLLYDVPKAIGETLRGHSVACLGGSSDTTFYAQMLQLQLPTVTTNITALAKALDQWSLYDASGVGRDLDTDAHWSLVSLIARQGPKLSAGAKFQMQWPKSLKHAADGGLYACERGYVSKPHTQIDKE